MYMKSFPVTVVDMVILRCTLLWCYGNKCFRSA